MTDADNKKVAKIEKALKKLYEFEVKKALGDDFFMCKKCHKITNDVTHSKYKYYCMECVRSAIKSTRESHNKSKYKGVYFRYQKYIAKITLNGKNIYLGSFGTEKEAAEAYNDCVIKQGLKRPLNQI